MNLKLSELVRLKRDPSLMGTVTDSPLQEMTGPLMSWGNQVEVIELNVLSDLISASLPSGVLRDE
jgi:hypothetical protein